MKFIILALMMIGFCGSCFFLGRRSAFEDICLEKCWLNKTSLDIECISYIMK